MRVIDDRTKEHATASTADVEEDANFCEACALLWDPQARSSSPGCLFIVSLALFVLFSRGHRGPTELAYLLGVLLFHEAGHWAGMRLFGYRDTRVFFIPFFGAAASGRKDGAPQWQQAIVSLLGPLPGLALAFALALGEPSPPPWRSELTRMLLWLNAFNLLPFEPLDGGRFLQATLFSRRPWPEAIFRGCTTAGLAAFGLALGAPLLCAFGLLGLLFVAPQFRIARAARALRRQWTSRSQGDGPYRADGHWQQLPANVEEADEPMLRDLFDAASPIAARAKDRSPRRLADLMRQIFNRAAARPVGAAGTLGLLAVYGVAVLLSLLGLAFTAAS